MLTADTGSTRRSGRDVTVMTRGNTDVSGLGTRLGTGRARVSARVTWGITILVISFSSADLLRWFAQGLENDNFERT